MPGLVMVPSKLCDEHEIARPDLGARRRHPPEVADDAARSARSRLASRHAHYIAK